MSAGLVVASQNLEVESFAEGAPVRVGESSRAFAGGARSTVRASKRVFNAVTAPYGKTVYDALRAACANEATVTVSGNCLLGVSLSCVVRITYALVGIGSTVDGYNFLYQLTLAIEEV